MCPAAQRYPALCKPLDWSPPGSSVHESFRARILEQVVISSSRGSSQPRAGTRVSCLSCRRIPYPRATGDAPMTIQGSAIVRAWCKSGLLPVFQIKFHWNTGFPGGSDIKNLPAIQETQVPSLGREDPLEKDMVTHSGILAWRIPWAEERGRPQSMRVTRSWTRLKRPSTHARLAVFALWMQRWLVAAQAVWPQT